MGSNGLSRRRRNEDGREHGGGYTEGVEEGKTRDRYASISLYTCIKFSAEKKTHNDENQGQIFINYHLWKLIIDVRNAY